MSSDFHFLIPESFHTKFGSDRHNSRLAMDGWSSRSYIPSFVEIGPPVPKKIFEGFLPYMGVAAILVM